MSGEQDATPPLLSALPAAEGTTFTSFVSPSSFSCSLTRCSPSKCLHYCSPFNYKLVKTLPLWNIMWNGVSHGTFPCLCVFCLTFNKTGEPIETWGHNHYVLSVIWGNWVKKKKKRKKKKSGLLEPKTKWLFMYDLIALGNQSRLCVCRPVGQSHDIYQLTQLPSVPI